MSWASRDGSGKVAMWGRHRGKYKVKAADWSNLTDDEIKAMTVVAKRMLKGQR